MSYWSGTATSAKQDQLVMAALTEAYEIEDDELRDCVVSAIEELASELDELAGKVRTAIDALED